VVAELLDSIRPLVYDDLANTPDDGRRYEILQGELIISGPPDDTHQLILGRVFARLDAAVAKSEFGSVRLGPRDVRITKHNIVVPDLIAYRTTQRAQATERIFEGAPTFICEITSEDSRRYDLVRKASLYVNSGVDEYWIVDREKQRVLIYQASRGVTDRQIVTEGSIISNNIPGFSIDFADLFAPEGEIGS